jgi:carboxymethylenebutenolidase
VTRSRTEAIRAGDGGELAGHLVLPDSGAGPGLLILQEIFGLSPYIREVCERVAGLGYVALAPDLYWRIEPGVAIDEREPEGFEQALGYMSRLDFEKAVDDSVAALDHLRRLPEVRRAGVGVMGFCLGGGLAFRVAAASDPDCVVCYYGSALAESLEHAGDIHCPILFHFGDADQYLTPEKQERVRAALGGRPELEFHTQPGANHAFDNHYFAFHHPEAAARAWELTKEFLKERLPTEL